LGFEWIRISPPGQIELLGSKEAENSLPVLVVLGLLHSLCHSAGLLVFCMVCRSWGIVRLIRPPFFLQTDLALRAKVAQKWSLGKGWDPSDSETFPDMNGKLCHLCGMPLPERSDRNYVQRTDCGNHSVFEHPEVWYKPIFQFNKEDTRSPKFHPGGELAILNMQKTWKIGRVKFYRT